MKSVVAFVVGAVVGATAAALLMRATGEGDSWRERAGQAEAALAAERRKTDAMAGQIRGLAERFDALATRLEALSSPDGEVLRPPDAPVPGADPTPPETQAPRHAAATPEFQPVPEEQWDALVQGTLESEIERRLGAKLPPERVERLMDSLRSVREAAANLTAEELDADDPNRARQDLTRTLVLLQADRAFREELGIGVAEFLRGFDPGQVQEVPR